MRHPKTFLCIVFLFAICFIPSAVLATPILEKFDSYGISLVRDQNTGDVWIADMGQFSNMKYAQVGKAIDQLNQHSYGGFNSWELATKDQVAALFTSIKSVDDAALFGVTYDAQDWGGYYGSWGITSTKTDRGNWYAPWMERSMLPGESDYLKKRFGGGQYSSNDARYLEDIGAWVKTKTAPVPEPATFLLLGTGLVAFASFKRRSLRK